MGVDLEEALEATRSFEFDKILTVKVFGYDHPEQYYREMSCVPNLHTISVPVLCLSALDDPVITQECIPYEEFKNNENLILGVTRCGGHIGWFSGFWNPRRWYVNPCMEFLNQLLNLEMCSSFR